MVKRCAWETCNTDSRYPERLVHVKFHRFPSVAKKKEQREIWIRACRRGDGFICTKDSYVCSLHFVSKKGPTEENPNPIPATASRKAVRIKIIDCFHKILYIMYTYYIILE